MRTTVSRAVFALILILVALAPAFGRGKAEIGELVSPEEAFALFEKGEAVFVDVRDRQSYVMGHIVGAVSYPLSAVSANAKTIAASGKTIITYCACPAEESSLAAAGDLVAAGITNILVLKGGIAGWAQAGYPVRPGERP